MARELVATPAADEHRLRLSYEQYLAWADEDTHAEWVDGEVIVFMPPDLRHQDLVLFLAELLRRFTRLFELGRIVVAPFEMRLAPGRSSREPDILFVARDHLHRLTRPRLEGPADLAIEVLSEESVRRDQVEKLAEYARAGVREYWWFDPRPRHQTARFYHLSDEGRYVASALDAAGRHHSVVLPGFWLDPSWLWQEPLPDPLTVLHLIAPDAVRTFVRSFDTDPTGGAS